MMKLEAIRAKFEYPEIDYTALVSALSGYRQVRAKIRQLLREGVIERVKKGLYVFGPAYARTPISKEILANLIYGPSCISLEYALAYYGLIPERVEQVTSITPKRNKRFATSLGIFSYRYLPLEKYTLGLTLRAVDDKRQCLIATPEKALVDYLYFLRNTQVDNFDEVRVLLFDDVRLDEAAFFQFDIDLFQQLAQVYRHPIITRAFQLLRSHHE